MLHDREIVARCDDSVLAAARRASGVGAPRARPHADAAGRRAWRAGAGLGRAAEKPLTVASGNGLAPSQHLGDLDHPDSWDVLEDAVRHWLTLTGAQPTRIAHDRHPDALSSRLAAELALRFDAS
ncbi:MAG: hypothetical protein U1E47_05885 [Rivihabitans pingtungensis]